MDKKPILIVVPSRSQGTGREKNVERFIEAWKTHTEGLSNLCIALDPDDFQYYERDKSCLYFINNVRQRMIPTLNACVNSFADSYEMIAFFGDDHLIKTNWESEFYNKNKEIGGFGIFYGNDLLQGERLATAVCLDARIVQTLGFIAPTMLTHLFADNFWMDLGRATNKLHYFDSVIFEHLHPHIGKTDSDVMYVESNSFFDADQKLYEQYQANGVFESDVERIKTKINESFAI